MCLLITRVETRAKAELSKRLAPLDYAPFEVIQHLAKDDEIAVAGEVLAHSSRVTTDTLLEVASTKGQDHLLAISGRAHLPEKVTDVIVDRGEVRVIRRLANNAGARFSEAGYSGIVARAGDDDELTEILGLRIDLPVQCLRDLVRRAKDAVRARLLKIAPAAAAAGNPARARRYRAREPAVRRNFGIAEQLVKLMKELNELDDAAVFTFAEQKKFDEVIVSLAVLNDAPVEMIARLVEGPRADLILIPCRSAKLNWPTVETILRNRPVKPPISEATLEQAQRDYRRLSIGDRPAHRALLAAPQPDRKAARSLAGNVARFYSRSRVGWAKPPGRANARPMTGSAAHHQHSASSGGHAYALPTLQFGVLSSSSCRPARPS